LSLVLIFFVYLRDFVLLIYSGRERGWKLIIFDFVVLFLTLYFMETLSA